jgi:hypothetical protein
MHDRTILEAAQRLLDRACLGPDELAWRLAKARSATYWEGLNPSLSVGRDGAATDLEGAPLGPRRRTRVAEQFRADGYFEVTGVLSRPALRRMRRAVEVLRGEGWPAVFAFVYDEFWLVTRVPSLVRLLSAILGPGYRQVSDAWSFYVPAVRGAAGFPPHSDAGALPDPRSRLTLWVPLSDAALDNGCVYVIPRRRVAEGVAARFSSGGDVSRADTVALLQASRAVPARPGAILGWDHGLIHWGSVCGGAGEPRVSIGTAFLAEGASPRPDEFPLFDPRSTLPTFAQRLRLIARMFPYYEGREPLVARYLDLAKRLLEDGEGEACPAASES